MAIGNRDDDDDDDDDDVAAFGFLFSSLASLLVFFFFFTDSFDICLFVRSFSFVSRPIVYVCSDMAVLCSESIVRASACRLFKIDGKRTVVNVSVY